MTVSEGSRAAVPFADLHAQYLSIREEIDAAMADVIRTSSFVRGTWVDRFEREFAAITRSANCVSCANGTDSLYIAMHALGVKPGDEIIVPAMSWISTSETVTQAGGNVVFCDVDPKTYTIDTEKLAGLVTSRTVGIIPVHLYGQPADMDRVMAIAGRHGLWVIEDCAQAHLATYRQKQVGSFGTAASFSFYPGKNLGAMGDAGAITTSDSALASRMAMFARHGGLTKGDHQIEGINSRLDGLQAAILSVKVQHLQAWTDARRRLAKTLTSRISGLQEIEVPFVNEACDPVWHLYVVELGNRDGLAAHLKERGIQTAINYPRALPFLPCYSRLGHRAEDFPAAHQMQSRILSLPLFPEMTAQQLDALVSGVVDFKQ